MLTVSPCQALLQAGDLDSCCEPAGSEAAKFRLWVKSKGLSLRPGPGEASSHQQDSEADTRLYLPTGTEQVRSHTRILFLVLLNTSKRGD